MHIYQNRVAKFFLPFSGEPPKQRSLQQVIHAPCDPQIWVGMLFFASNEYMIVSYNSKPIRAPLNSPLENFMFV